MKLLLGLLALPAMVILGLQFWRFSDVRMADRIWQRLSRMAPAHPERFDPARIEGLPEPARRYFLFTIRPGARLATVAGITMAGELSLGTKDAPNDQPMQAAQILAPPHGLVWKLRAGRGLMRVSGSDGITGTHSWVRFWLMGVLPVMRAGGTTDHARAAFGRLVAEAAFWAPAALLPQKGVTWEAVDENTARARVTYQTMSQTVDIHVDQEGRPLWVMIPRWTDANADKVYRMQPFGGFVSAFREFDGFMLPTRVDGGNFFGTEDYFPFYKARVGNVRFIVGGQGTR